MPAPPTKAEVLKLLEVVTPPDYHEPFVTDPDGAIAQYRGWARAKAELAKAIARAASRQLFLAGPGRESAGFVTRATMIWTLRRIEYLDRLVLIETGALIADALRERVYRSTHPVIWYPNDPTGDIEVELQCDFYGEFGNLDFLADANGELTDPVTGLPAFDVVDMRDQAQGRAGIRGVLTLTANEPARLTDNGIAPTFSEDDVGLYLEITYAGTLANIGRVLRIVGFETEAMPATSGYTPRTVLLDDEPLPSLVTGAVQDDGGTLTDYTDEARSRTSNDLPLLPASPAVNDATYLLADEPFGTVSLSITSELIGTLTLALEYWDGATWSALSDIKDTSEGFTKTGQHTISWTIPGGWAGTTVDTRTGYAMRFRVSAFTSLTNQPFAALALVLIEDPLAADPLDANGFGQIGWRILGWRDLGIEVDSIVAPADGREGELAIKLRERGLVQRPGESVDALRRRASMFPAVVTPEHIEWEINRILEPLGVAGKVVDVGDGFQGLFWDVPPEFAPDVVAAWDLYGPGDAHPIDQTFLPLSELEVRWHFFVVVPQPTLGEFGAAWDDGPAPIYVEALGQFLGSAWDAAVLDGYAAVSAALYKAVYETVLRAKAGGISFELILGEVPVCP